MNGFCVTRESWNGSAGTNGSSSAVMMSAGTRTRSMTRIALGGLRGAGKSTLGQMLADDLGFPFVELSREIGKFAGCTISEIQARYGMNAYRRYEGRALEEAPGTSQRTWAQFEQL